MVVLVTGQNGARAQRRVDKELGGGSVTVTTHVLSSVELTAVDLGKKQKTVK